MNKKDKNRRNLSRRDFVHNSAKVIIGTSILPTLLPSCSTRKGANDKIPLTHSGKGVRANPTSIVPIWGTSPIVEPYPYVSRGSFSGPAVPSSPDPWCVTGGRIPNHWTATYILITMASERMCVYCLPSSLPLSATGP